ncbi:MAG: RHS repeat-associated core domain-containing protein [Bacteroidia bacterium]|nr:RHS repeat-associated core domain-containing protein [Bacteroidia bacterium]
MNTYIQHRLILFVLMFLLAGISFSSIQAQSQYYLTDTSIINKTDLLSADSINFIVSSVTVPNGCGYARGNGTFDVRFATDDDYEFGSTSFSYYTIVTIFGYDALNNILFQKVETLALSQTQPEVLMHVDFSDVAGIVDHFKVEYTSCSGCSSSYWATWVKLTAWYIIDLHWLAMSANELVSGLSVDMNQTNTNRVRFSWSSDCPYSDYEFQLLKMYDTTSTDRVNEDEVDAWVDWNKALTIETQSNQTFLDLTLTEGTGYYIWRVRPISTQYPGGKADSRNYGSWSHHIAQGTLYNFTDNTSVDDIFFYNQFNEDINWIYSRVFSEGGAATKSPFKLKETISFANGLQQMEQDQVHLESADTVMVKATVYDYAGRPALTSLPVPVSTNSLEYVQDLLKERHSDSLYSARHFDSDSTWFAPKQTVDSIGFYTYYSENNSDVYVPDAEKYPFSRTLYQGGTGRVIQQSNPGAIHTVRKNDSHTIKTYYTGVADNELVRVMANEAPAGNSVYKEIVTDPNNSTSVKYYENDGKLIATCLAVNPYRNAALESLSSQADANFSVNFATNGNTQNGNLITAQGAFILFDNDSTTVDVNYTITPQRLENDCDTTICRTCDYVVRLRVINTDLDSVITADTLEILHPDSCQTTKTITHSFKLPAGSYLLQKEVTVMNSDSQGNLFMTSDVHDLFTADSLLIRDSVEYYIHLLDSLGVDSFYYTFGVNVNAYLFPDKDLHDSTIILPVNSCFSIPIPVMACPNIPCDVENTTAEQAELFMTYFSSYNDTVITNHDTYLGFFGSHYTWNTFATMVDNMLQDGYDCEAIWNCWRGVVYSYGQYQTISGSDSSNNHQLNLVSEFLACTGYHFNSTDTSQTAVYPHAYEWVYYNPAIESHTACKEAINQLVCADTTSCANCLTRADDDFTCWGTGTTLNHYLELLNNCIGSQSNYFFDDCADCFTFTLDYFSNPANTQDVIDSIAQANMDKCRERCDQRRAGFESNVVQLIHDQQDYIEGDWHQLAADTTFGLHYIFDYSTSHDPDIFDKSKSQVQCLTNALVDYCMEGCELTKVGDSWGDSTQWAHFQRSFNGMYDLSFNGGTGWDTVSTNGIRSEIMSATDVTDTTYGKFLKVWDKVDGGGNTETLSSVIQTKDKGLLLIGTSNTVDTIGNKDGLPAVNEDYWIVKKDSSGAKEWGIDIQAADKDFLKCAIQTCDEGYLLAGTSRSDSVPGYSKLSRAIGYDDFWIIKLDKSGNRIWDKTYGGTDNDDLKAIVELPDKSIMLCGSSFSDSSGNKTTHNRKNGIYSTSDYWVIKVSSLGEIIWDKTYGGYGSDVLTDAILTGDNNVLLCGYTNSPLCDTCSLTSSYVTDTLANNSTDYWLVKIDKNGNVLWNEVLGGNNDDFAWSVTETPDWNIIIAGSSYSTQGYGDHNAANYSESDLWLVRTNPFGQYQYDRTFGSDVHEAKEGADIMRARSGNYYLMTTAEVITINDTTSTRHATGSLASKIMWSVIVDDSLNYIYDIALQGLGYLNPITFSNNGTSVIQTFDRDIVFGGYSNDTIGNQKSAKAFNLSNDYWTLKYKYVCKDQTICIKWKPFPVISDTLDGFVDIQPMNCEQAIISDIKNMILIQANDFIESHRLELIQEYQNKCTLAASLNDSYTAQYNLAYHHYTLYYYDRAGHLIKTVPPAAIDLTQTYSRSDTTVYPLATTYQYNSLGQLIEQKTPDAGETKFYYNSMGLLRFSQSAQQTIDEKFSYTKYDNNFRVIESGEGADGNGFMDQAHLDDNTWPSASHCKQQVYTVYTTPGFNIHYLDGSSQHNLLNRISYTYTADSVYTWYSYDPHGNVEWLIQELPYLGKQYIGYDYDLVNGNVLKVKYNEGKIDQFFHRYTYDADNRIVLTETSVDGNIWDKDAQYSYFLHGPLRRTLLGEDKVQGTDYTYTLQGWLKSINQTSLIPSLDPGFDARNGAANENVAQDAFAMQLEYFNSDFTRTNSFMTINDASTYTGYDGLYNGNIAAWTYQHKTNNNLNYNGLQGDRFHYDELNRLLTSQWYDNSLSTTGTYETRYLYDPNGNINSLLRFDENGNTFDDFTYNYNNNTNQVNSVIENISGMYTTDLQKSLEQLIYDANGNLISSPNNDDEIDTIYWTAFGKIKKIVRTSNSEKDRLEYFYDAAGNRVIKKVTDFNDNVFKTFYIRDAQGNIMAVYEDSTDYNYELIKYKLKEQPIYGSSRLGTRTSDLLVKTYDWHHNEVLETDYSEIKSEKIRLGTTANYSTFIIPNIDDVSSANLSLMSFKSNVVIPLQSPKTGIKYVNFSGATPTYPNVSFLSTGLNPGALAAGEDRYGNVWFDGVTFQTINSMFDVTVLRDRSNNIINNCYSIPSSFKNEAMAMQTPDSAGQFYLFTLRGKPYCTTIDLTNTTAPEARNINFFNNSYFGRTMALLADYRPGYLSYLYLRSYNSDSTSIWAFPVYPDSVGTGRILKKQFSKDNAGVSQIRVSPDGTMLAVADKENGTGSYLRGTIYIYSLNATHDTLSTAIDSVRLPNAKFCKSFDFSPENKYIYFTEINQGMGTPVKIKRHLINNFTGNAVSLANATGEVRRSKNGKIYVTPGGTKNQYIITNPDAATPTCTLTQTMTDANWKYANFMMNQPVCFYTKEENLFTRNVNKKQYELTDHLGNVRIVLSDVKEYGDTVGGPNSFTVNDLTTNNYMPFGFPTPGRNYFGATTYRFGFNGKEKDDEITGSTGSNLDFGARIYDSRIARWLTIDPLSFNYPFLSPYQYCANNPIIFVDPDGKKIKPTNETTTEVFQEKNSSYKRVLGIVEEDGVYSATEKYSDQDEFRTALKLGDVKMTENQINEAWDYYGLLSTREIIEVTCTQYAESNSDQTTGNIGNQNDPSHLGKGGLLTDSDKRNHYARLLKKEGVLTKRLNDALYDGKPINDEDISAEVLVDKRGKGWAFFKNNGQNKSVKGEVLIDATGKSKRRIGTDIIKKTKEAVSND